MQHKGASTKICYEEAQIEKRRYATAPYTCKSTYSHTRDSILIRELASPLHISGCACTAKPLAGFVDVPPLVMWDLGERDSQRCAIPVLPPCPCSTSYSPSQCTDTDVPRSALLLSHCKRLQPLWLLLVLLVLPSPLLLLFSYWRLLSPLLHISPWSLMRRPRPWISLRP